MSNILDLSDAKITVLQDLGKTVNIDDIKHMRVGEDQIDTSKANTWLEAGAALSISKDPRKQSKDEKKQIAELTLAFNGFHKLDSDAKFLISGKVCDSSPDPDPMDLDAELEDTEWLVEWSLKHTTGAGGSQNKVFREVLDLVAQAPDLASTDKTILALYLTGDFWETTMKRQYKNWEKKYPFPTTKIDLIKLESYSKKVIVVTELPTTKSSFYDLYIKDSYDI